MALAFDKLTLDFRYWDTNVSGNQPVGINPNNPSGQTNICKQDAFQCDSKFVFSAKITF